MKTIDPTRSTLLIIDFQKRLMQAIDRGDAAVVNAKRLLDAAALLEIPVVVTEQNPKGLGATLDELAISGQPVIVKMEFDASQAAGFFDGLPEDRPDLVVAGCEAHVCVLQTVLGLLDRGRRVYVARDALGSRTAENKEAAIARMERHGAEIVTAEMIVFEWLQTAAHPRFRETAALIR